MQYWKKSPQRTAVSHFLSTKMSAHKKRSFSSALAQTPTKWTQMLALPMHKIFSGLSLIPATAGPLPFWVFLRSIYFQSALQFTQGHLVVYAYHSDKCFLHCWKLFRLAEKPMACIFAKACIQVKLGLITYRFITGSSILLSKADSMLQKNQKEKY